MYNLIVNKGFKELNPLITGYEKCDAGHSYGPSVREYYLLHYIKSGCGVYKCNENTYTLRSGQVFLIKPEEQTYYQADYSEPWEYIWIGFDGTLSEKFDSLPYVFEMKSRLFYDILLCQGFTNCKEEFLTAKLFEIYCELFDSIGKPRKDYVRQVCDYINFNYANDLSVQSMAEMLKLERTYFSKIFKEKMHESVQDYIINIRLNKALGFLENGSNVSEAAQLCGYHDVFNFSKMFKKRYGVSPKHFITANNQI